MVSPPSPSNNNSFETPTQDGAGTEVMNTAGMTAIRDAKQTLFSSASLIHFLPHEPPSKAGSPTGKEGCIQPSRRSQKALERGNITVFVDLPVEEVEAIPRQILHTLSKKAFLLSMTYHQKQQTYLGLTVGTGQAGILLDDNGNAFLVTTRHSIARDSKEKLVSVDSNLEFGPHQAERVGNKPPPFLRWPQGNRDTAKAWKLPLRGGLSWYAGWDVDAIPLLLSDDDGDVDKPWWSKPWTRFHNDNNKRLLYGSDIVVDRSMAFQKAKANFDYKKGDRIAIVVSSFGMKKTATPETASIVDWGCQNEGSQDGPSQETFTKIYGEPGGVSIYLGEITHVGRNHIEHNINTYQGCSGATIFYWDLDLWAEHPETFMPQAIAVHVGYQGVTKRNIGLKLCNGPKLGPLEYIRPRIASWHLPPAVQSNSTNNVRATNGASKPTTGRGIDGPDQTNQETIPGIKTNKTVSKSFDWSVIDDGKGVVLLFIMMMVVP